MNAPARAHRVLPVAARRVALVFGMRWHTILGSQLNQEARRRAASVGATHLVHADPQAESVGTIRLARAERVSLPMLSAAQAFALLHPAGLALGCLALPDGGRWVAAVRDGAVLGRTDVVYATREAAEHAVAELCAQSPDMVRYGDLPGGLPLDVDVLAGEVPRAALLQARTRAWTAVPRPVLLLLLIGALVPAGQAGWHAYQARQRQADEAQRLAARPDPAAAWRDSDARHVAAIGQLAHRELAIALETLGQMPLNVAGWRFDGARCEPAAQRRWRCDAIYQRGMFSATNAGFAAAKPEWQNLWAPLDQVTPSFVSAVPGEPLGLAELPTLSEQNLRVLSALQRLRAAFGTAELGPVEAVEVVAPQDLDGAPLVRPVGAPVLTRRRLRLQGPLRSVHALAETEGPYRWSRLTLDVRPASRPTLTSSALMATLEGALYAYGD